MTAYNADGSGYGQLRSAAVAVLLAVLLQACPAPASVHLPLTVTDATATNGTITVETADWRLVFDRLYNGGIHQWFDLAADPAATDSLAGALAGTFPYSQGALFGYQAYLHSAPSMEFMTTMGVNADPGSTELLLIESTQARVRIRQRGQPRLNNGAGPTADVFPEMGIITTTTVWTIYPTGKVHIDFTTEVVPGGITIDAGAAGKGITASGSSTLIATAGNDLRENGILPGDRIESAGGGWGPLRIMSRPAPTELVVASPVPAGTFYDYVVTRREIAGETISIHGDGDPGFGFCGSHPWEAGSVDKPLWEDSPIPQLVPNLAGQFLLAQWATESRQAGSLLTFFEQPWTDPNLAAFDSCFYEDISYTQIGRFALEVPQDRHLHLLAHMGSAASCRLPSLRSVADALPYGLDYRAPYADAVVGTLDIGAEIAWSGFDPGAGTYGVTADSVAPSRCGAAVPPCHEAVLRLDTQGPGRSGAEYRAPAVRLSAFPVPDGLVSVEMSTDGGATFEPLAAKMFNLTGQGDEGALGSGRRLFQYLGTIPAAASGSNAVAFRFVGPVTPAPPPPPTGPCASTPVPSGCRSSEKASLKVTYAGGDGNRLTWRWSRGDVPVTSFGDPAAACGTGFALCIYDGVDNVPALAVKGQVAGGGTCAGRACWKTIGSAPVKGFRFKDQTLAQSGLKTLLLRGGDPGTGKVVANGRDGTLLLPAAATPAQYFRHEGDVVVQLVNDAGECWESRFAVGDVLTNAPDSYRASFRH